MSKILSFIRILYLKQLSDILQCFCSLKFAKKVCFFSFIFGTKMVVNTAEKVKYFAQN